MTDTEATEATDRAEPDNPDAYALARHIADHPMSTIYAAFRYLNAPLTVEFHEDPAVPAATPAPAGVLRQRMAEAIDGLRENGGVYAIDDAERDRIADAALAVRDRYVEQLEAGRATWKRKAEEIEADRDRLVEAMERAKEGKA